MTNRITERKLVSNFRDCLFSKGRAIRTIVRADGTVEESVIENQELAAGLNELATKAISSRQNYGWIAVGTATAAASLGSTWGGEVSRKAGATLTTSKMTMILVSTWGGSADSVTSLALETAAIVDNASSGSGVPLNILTGVNATLANSDLLKLQMEFQIGSHNL